MDRALRRRSRRSCATSTTSPTASTCAATSARHARDRGRASTRRTSRWTVDDRHGRARVGALLHHGDRLPVVAATCRRSPGSRRFAGPMLPHRPLAARGRRLHRPARRRDRHRLVGIQAIPHDRRAGRRSSTVFQRTPNFSVPARNAPLDPETSARVKAELRRAPRGARESRRRLRRARTNDQRRARRSPTRSASASYEERWRRGRPRLHRPPSPTCCSTRTANETAAEFVRAQDPRDRAATPRSPRRSCRAGLPDRHQAALRRHRLLRDLQPRRTSRWSTSARDPIDGDHRRAGMRTARREYELDAIVFATGFDAMTGALLAIDIRGRGGVALRDKWADGPAHLPRASASPASRTCSSITGPGSPSVLSNMIVSIEQHVDWIADCIAHLRARGLGTHRGRRRRPRTPGSRTSTRSATPRSSRTANSWYMGANIPGKPRVFMPYIGGFGAYRAEVRRGRGQRLRGILAHLTASGEQANAGS